MTETTHRMKCICGEYKCTDCDYATLNVWCAKQHYADKNGIDVDVIDSMIN